MAFLTIEDIYGQLSVLVFPDSFEKNRELITQDSKLIIKGRASINRDETASLIAGSIYSIEDVNRELWIAFDDMEAYKKKAAELDDISFEHQGGSEVVVYLKKERMKKNLGRERRVNVSSEVIAVYEDAFGKDNVRTRVVGLKKGAQ